MTIWDPAHYSTFSEPRTRAALDLLDRVPPMDAHTIYDLGCGTGEITREIARRWPEAAVVGLDNSPEMLERARLESGRHAGATIDWQLGNIAWWRAPAPGSVDLIYTNAALHWLGDHQTLFPSLIEQLRPGGVLAVQMPLSWYAPSHRLMREVLTTGGEGGVRLGDESLHQRYARPPVMQPEAYYELISPLVERVDIWKTEYLHVLTGEDPIFSWVSGTGLRPILQALEDVEHKRFVTQYKERLRATYPANSRGLTLYPFPRLFLVATV